MKSMVLTAMAYLDALAFVLSMNCMLLYSEETAQKIKLLEHFGHLIANTDVHFRQQKWPWYFGVAPNAIIASAHNVNNRQSCSYTSKISALFCI